MKRLIVTADDFGLTPGVVAGIVEAHEKGIVSATSVMVNAPAAEQAFEWARQHTSLDAGLHFVLTFGEPVGPPESLGDLVGEDGCFRRLGSGAHAKASPDQVRTELRAQLDRFEARVGRPPAHIDGHHHVHALPGVLTAVLEESRRLDVPIRAPDDAARERALGGGVRTTGLFVDRFYGEDNVSEDALLAILDSLPDGTSELMCHPAREDSMLPTLSSYVEPRWQELRTLTSPRVRRRAAEFR